MLPSCDGHVRDHKLDDAFTDKLADDVLREPAAAHRDQRLEISLLALFTYDKLCTPLREKRGGCDGWGAAMPSGSLHEAMTSRINKLRTPAVLRNIIPL